nr:transposase [Ammoniphilus sp. YIM 78166]
MFVTEGKGAEVLLAFQRFLEGRGINSTQIQEVCCDMSPSFIAGIEKYFPKAHITFDKIPCQENGQ